MRTIRKRGDTRVARLIRHRRISAKVAGHPTRPRLCVFRSLNHIYGQIIDDKAGHTLASASTLDPEAKEKIAKLSKTESANFVGKVLAQRALEKGIKTVVFDRAGYRYHGRAKALAEGAREGGLSF